MNNGWTGGQYSIFRVILAICLCIWNVQVILAHQSAAAEWSGQGFLDAFLLVVVPVLCVLLAVGWHDWIAAMLLWGFAWLLPWALGLCSLPIQPPTNVPPVGMFTLLFLHWSVSAAPYGSLAARGRIDPGNSWDMSGTTYAFAWFMLALFLFFPPILDGDWLSVMPVVLFPLAFVPRLRPWCWVGLFVVLIWRLVASQWVNEAMSLILLQFFTFDPGWIPPLAISPPPLGGEGGKAEMIFYDGHCGLCHRAVRFVLAEDRTGTTFRFAPLDSDAFRAAVPEEVRGKLPDSIVVRTADGQILTQARAVLYIMRRLGGLWRLLAGLARLVPAALLDAAYNGIARIRYRLFAKPADACPILPPRLRGRFDF
jgi:predicted DCC family thiol-disulfide oxidoreductase YuxK